MRTILERFIEEERLTELENAVKENYYKYLREKEICEALGKKFPKYMRAYMKENKKYVGDLYYGKALPIPRRFSFSKFETAHMLIYDEIIPEPIIHRVIAKTAKGNCERNYKYYRTVKGYIYNESYERFMGYHLSVEFKRIYHLNGNVILFDEKTGEWV